MEEGTSNCTVSIVQYGEPIIAEVHGVMGPVFCAITDSTVVGIYLRVKRHRDKDSFYRADFRP